MRPFENRYMTAEHTKRAQYYDFAITMAPAAAHPFLFNMGLFCATHLTDLSKLMHLPFFEWGIMNLGTFSFPDVAVILHLLPISTPHPVSPL